MVKDCSYKNNNIILSISHSLYLSKSADTEPINTKSFFVLTTSNNNKNPQINSWKFVKDGFVTGIFQITIKGTLRMTNTSPKVILEQVLVVPPNFEINMTIRSAAYCCQKLEPDCMVGLVWKKSRMNLPDICWKIGD